MEEQGFLTLSADYRWWEFQTYDYDLPALRLCPGHYGRDIAAWCLASAWSAWCAGYLEGREAC